MEARYECEYGAEGTGTAKDVEWMGCSTVYDTSGENVAKIG